MSDKIVIKVRNRRKTKVKPNLTVNDVLRYTKYHSDLPVLAAKVNNRLVSLNYTLKIDSNIEPVTYNSKVGAAIYRRSLSHILCQAIIELFPEARPVVGQSIMNGYYYDIKGISICSQKILTEISQRMNQIISEDRPFEFLRYPVEYTKNLFDKYNFPDKSELLNFFPQERVSLCKCGSFTDIAVGPFIPSTSYITAFKLVCYPPGFVLKFPSSRNPYSIPDRKHEEKNLFSIYQETRKWNRILKLEKVSDLNNNTVSGKISDLIKVAEGLHEKKIVSIADNILKSKEIRLVLIAGPSSSGKTTFAKRLITQLKVNGFRPVQISIDDYFVDRDKTPRDRKGNYDFESLGSVDTKLLNNNLRELFAGNKVGLPIFDFKKGKQILNSKYLKIDSDQIIILEGIHGLNDNLTPLIPSQQKYKIYISALTQLCLDNNNRIFTSDTRLLRRIVRDYNFRGYSASDTLSGWASVRRGEARNIFPYQEKANVMFNSALIYEHSVLKFFAQPLLNRVRPNNINYPEARRLYDFLEYFVPIFPDEVPHVSILREFIGGSAFKY